MTFYPAKSPKSSRRPVAIDLFAEQEGCRSGSNRLASMWLRPSSSTRFIAPSMSSISQVVRRSVPTPRKSPDLRFAEKRDWNGPYRCGFRRRTLPGLFDVGKRALDDPRNGLLLQFLRLVVELEADYLVFENVKGLTVGEHRKLLQELIDAFGGEGYDMLLPYRVLNAADYGVPQDRKRLFLIGGKKGLPLPHYPAPHRKRPTVWQAIGDLPNADEFEELIDGDAVDRSRFGKGSPYARILRGQDADASDFSYPREWSPRRLTSSMRTKHTELSQKRFEATPHGKVEVVSRFLSFTPMECATHSAPVREAIAAPSPLRGRSIRICRASLRFGKLRASTPIRIGFGSTRRSGTAFGKLEIRFRRCSDAPWLRSWSALSGVTPKKPERNLEPWTRIFADDEDERRRCPFQSFGLCTGSTVERNNGRGSRDGWCHVRMNVYQQIILHIFRQNFKEGAVEFEFGREEIAGAAASLEIKMPKNPGDVVYSFRYRNKLPKEILDTQPEGLHWLILGAGAARYRFRLNRLAYIYPTKGLLVRKVPDATPEIIAQYALTDEQALLAKIRYNRLIDMFLGIVAYSLQTHLRTTIDNYGQIEIDELYVGVDARGVQYIVPVQAKGGKDVLASSKRFRTRCFARMKRGTPLASRVPSRRSSWRTTSSPF